MSQRPPTPRRAARPTRRGIPEIPEIAEITGRVDGTGAGRRFGVVAARFNDWIVDALVRGALDCLLAHGVAPADIRLVRVPGAWEIPAALAELAAPAGDPQSGWRPHGLVALGALLRGETRHYEVICDECGRGVAAVTERYRIPVGFGVLTCETAEQAEARAGGEHGNKGEEAALAALEMADLFARLRP
jgi:6,7-dimethyl-8-ribityllumazine synthase